MTLKGSEKFVADSLKKHFAKTNIKPIYREGENPPDIYLKLDNGEVPIEISDLNVNTIKKNTSTVYGYISFIKDINTEFEKKIPSNMVLIIRFCHFDTKVNKIKKAFKKDLSKFLENIKVGTSCEKCIDNKVCFRISVVNSSSKKKIQGLVTSYGMLHKKSRNISTVARMLADFNIDLNTLNLIEERIQTKTKKCITISQPVWLALNDRYYQFYRNHEENDHITHYRNALDNINDFGVFEKILITFENGDVLEFIC